MPRKYNSAEAKARRAAERRAERERMAPEEREAAYQERVRRRQQKQLQESLSQRPVNEGGRGRWLRASGLLDHPRGLDPPGPGRNEEASERQVTDEESHRRRQQELENVVDREPAVGRGRGWYLRVSWPECRLPTSRRMPYRQHQDSSEISPGQFREPEQDDLSRPPSRRSYHQ